MAKTRIYELAKELGLESKAVLEQAQALGLAVKTASSGLEEGEVVRVRTALSGNGATQEAAPPGDGPSTTEAAEQEISAVAAVDEDPPAAVEPEQAVPAEAEAVAEPAADEEEERPSIAVEPPARDSVDVPSGSTPEELGRLIGQAGTEVVKALVGMGEIVGLTAPMSDEAAELVGELFGWEVNIERAEAEEAPIGPKPKRTYDDDPDSLVSRPPVVTVMGHVDHGKTTLLDKIRATNVVGDEAGGITQHIGAYQVTVNGNLITFLDTPGHEAFTALRARGAEVTDIVVLVVAADDGIMPQTVEAISHSKAADVPLIVAINKMDLPGADPYAVRAQLTEQGLVVEELGGDVISVELSATTGDGIDTLLEMIDLVAQVEEFKGNPKAPASGVIVESQLDVGRGPVATVIVQRGTLRRGDALVAGPVSGRVRAMLDHTGEQLKEAGPSTPVLVMGWGDVPTAGDPFDVTENEKLARSQAQATLEEMKEAELVIPTARERLAQLLEQLRTADEAELRLIVKADAHGSLEAVRESVVKITREGGTISIVHGAVGGISENDVSLAEVTEAVVFGFNVRPDSNARKLAEQKGIEIRTYQIIYELLDDIEAMLVGRLAPEEVERVVGAAEVREIFKVPRAGNIAGSYVTEGQIRRGARVRLLRDGVVVHTGLIDSLRRFKDDVREVNAGFECGIGIAGYNDVKQGDVIETFEILEVART